MGKTEPGGKQKHKDQIPLINASFFARFFRQSPLIAVPLLITLSASYIPRKRKKSAVSDPAQPLSVLIRVKYRMLGINFAKANWWVISVYNLISVELWCFVKSYMDAFFHTLSPLFVFLDYNYTNTLEIHPVPSRGSERPLPCQTQGEILGGPEC